MKSDGSRATGRFAKHVAVLGREAGVSLAGRLIGSLLQITTHIVLSRLLGVSLYGLYALGWAIIQVVGLLARLGLDKGVIRYGADYLNRGDPGLKWVIRFAILINLAVGAALGAIIFLLAPRLADGLFGKPELAAPLKLFALWLPVIAGTRVAAVATRISKRMLYSVATEKLVQPALQLVLIFLFVQVAGSSVSGAINALGISSLAAFFMAVLINVRLFPVQGTSGKRPLAIAWTLVAFSAPTSLAGMLAKLNSWVDRLFIGHYLPVADVGVYQAASQFSTLFVVLSSIFNGIFAVIAADLFAKNETSTLNRLFKVNTKWAMYSCLPVFVIFLFSAEPLMRAAFGSAFAAGGGPLILLSAGQLINAGTGAVGLLMMMSGNQNRWLAISLVMFSLNVAGNMILIPRFGIIGAAMATAFSLAALFIAGLAAVFQRLRMWPYDKRFLKGLFAAIVSAVSLGLTELVLPKNPLWQVIAAVAVVGVTFSATLLLLGLDDEDKQILKQLKSRLKRTDGNGE